MITIKFELGGIIIPYIKQERRSDLDGPIDEIVGIIVKSDVREQDGQLNYVVFRLLKGIYQEGYFNYNRALGVLSAVEKEFYRRRVAPYEDKKIKENGDV